MTNFSGETKSSTIAFINITGMLSAYPVEQYFQGTLNRCSTSSHETICSWNPLFLSGSEPIRYFSSS